MTDTEKALHILKQAGTLGIHSFLMNEYIGTDRAAARINELKNKGYTITTTPEKLNGSWGVRYFLSSPPPQKKIITYKFEGQTAIPIYG